MAVTDQQRFDPRLWAETQRLQAENPGAKIVLRHGRPMVVGGNTTGFDVSGRRTSPGQGGGQFIGNAFDTRPGQGFSGPGSGPGQQSGGMPGFMQQMMQMMGGQQGGQQGGQFAGTLNMPGTNIGDPNNFWMQQGGQQGGDPRTQFFARMMGQRGGGGMMRAPMQSRVLPGQQQGPTDFNAVRSQQQLDQLLSKARRGGLTQIERDRMIQLQSQVG